MRIHLLCDHKWRDLPNLSAVSIELKRMGHKVLVSATKNATDMIRAFRPDCVVFNHLFSEANRKLAVNLRSSGIAVVILPTEGAMRPEFSTLVEGEFSDFSIADLILCWNEQSAQGIRARWEKGEEFAPVVGCGRTDFYFPQFRPALLRKNEFCERYGLDSNRKIVTWATQYGYAHLVEPKYSSELQKWLKESREVGTRVCYQRIGLEPERVPNLFAEDRAAAAKAFFALAGSLPEVQFLIKPHPIEDRSFYQKMIQKERCANVFFCPTEYIWNVLNVTDVLLHRHCTTAVEAWIWGKPTVEMAMIKIPQWTWPDRETGSNIAESSQELRDNVDFILQDSRVSEEMQSHRDVQIKECFGLVDGKRNRDISRKIDEFLSVRGKRRHFYNGIYFENSTFVSPVRAALGYYLNRGPGESIAPWNRKESFAVAEDKQIRKNDVAKYSKLVLQCNNTR
jgi:surface carbohydrate biosynthesis protein